MRRSTRTSGPTVRLHCENTERPCPHVGCIFNNYLNVSPKGKIKLTHPDRDPDEVPAEDSCCLDVADEGPQTLDRVGDILGLTRERVRQIEVNVLNKIRKIINEEDEEDP